MQIIASGREISYNLKIKSCEIFTRAHIGPSWQGFIIARLLFRFPWHEGCELDSRKIGTKINDLWTDPRSHWLCCKEILYNHFTLRAWSLSIGLEKKFLRLLLREEFRIDSVRSRDTLFHFHIFEDKIRIVNKFNE